MEELNKDQRFAHIKKDPRFRPVSKKEGKLKIDRRFASMFNDPKFKLKYTVDKRGKPLIKEHTTRDDMKKFYHLDQDENDESSTSSDEESENENKKTQNDDDDELNEILESDDENEKNSSSSSDEETPDVDNDGLQWNEFDEKCVRSDEVSHRLAVCNMDWDRVRAIDIFLLLNSWKPADGVIKSVTIYPSEYGLQQMEIEKHHGPLPGTTKPVDNDNQNCTENDHQNEAEDEPEDPEIKSDDDEEEDYNLANFNQDDDQDTTDPVMRERLRKYQLNRLKYYYAVVDCDTIETAVRIYEECDGMEYETSAVHLDLRFIPDSMTFDSSIQPYDQCSQLPEKGTYKPMLFRNTALTQTKVRCTWDETPIERRRLTKKKYTAEELDKINLDAYLASESEEDLSNDDDEEEENSNDEKDGVFQIPSNSNKTKRNLPTIRAPSVLSNQDDIDRYRTLLLDFNDDSKSKKKTTNFFDEQNNSNDDDDASDIDMEITWQPGLKSKAEEKLKNSGKIKEKKKTKKQIQEQNNEKVENNQETLELLTVDDDIDDKRDFNLRDLIKSHKKSENNLSNDKFQLNVNDKRFQAIYSQSEFNIDQSDPHFKATAGTQRLIEEKLKKRKLQNDKSSPKIDQEQDEIVAKLKRKSIKKE